MSLWAVLGSMPAHAAAPEGHPNLKRLAVLEFSSPDAARCASPRAASDKSLADHCQLLNLVADEARSGVLQALKDAHRDGEFLVMTRESMAAILTDMGNRATCQEGECEVETARSIGADYVVSGELRQLEGVLLVGLKLHETANGALLSTERCEEKGSLQLIRAVRQSASALLQHGLVGEGALAELSFGSVRVSMPNIDVASVGGADLKNINVKAEQLLEEALDRDESKDAPPESRAKAWCDLSRVYDRNPYQAKAHEACDAWASYSHALRRQEISLAEDYQTLAGYLSLKRKTREQRLSAVTGFLAAYKALSGRQSMDAVIAAKGAIEGNRATSLADLSTAQLNACEAGDSLACASYGNLLLKGIWPLERRPDQARVYLQRSCELGLSEGCRKLAGMLLESSNPGDQAQGAVLLKDACDFANAMACGALARARAEGKGGSRDLPLMISLRQRACDLGEAEECRQLSEDYAAGNGVRADNAKAMALLNQACDKGSNPACKKVTEIKEQAYREELAAKEKAQREQLEAQERQRRIQLEAERVEQESRVRDWENERADLASTRGWGWFLASVGAASAITAGTMAYLGSRQNDAIKAGGFATRADLADAESTGKVYNVVGYITAPVGAVALGLGSLLIFTHLDPGEYRGNVSVAVGPDGAVLAIKFP